MLFLLKRTFSLFLLLIFLSCSFKVAGVNKFENELAKQGIVIPVEFGLHTPLNDNFELSGSFNLNNVYGENTRLMDVDLTLRYLPFDYYLFRPYIGAGYGYYQLDETYELPCPDGYIC